jgi:hypothetical protein
MGYPLDTTAQNAVLDSMLGDNAGATMPSSFEVALFDAHPLAGGTELTSDGGYVRAVIANTSAVWPDAASGQKVSALLTFATSTDAWSDTATHYLLYDAADSTTAYFPGRLLAEVAVDAAGTIVRPSLVAFWNTTSA